MENILISSVSLWRGSVIEHTLHCWVVYIIVIFLLLFLQDYDDLVSSPGPVQNSGNKSNTMAPVINELNKWDTEAPFTLAEGDGVNVLAVSQQQIIEVSCVHCIILYSQKFLPRRNFRPVLPPSKFFIPY